MTSPPRTVQVTCPGCGHVYEDWYRASINLRLDNFDDEYIEQATSATCPRCQHKVRFGALIVNAGGRFTMPAPPTKPKRAKKLATKKEK